MSKKKFLIIFSLNLGYLLLRHLTVSNNFLVTTPFSSPIIPSFFRLIPEFFSFFTLVYCLYKKNKNIANYWWLFLFILLFSLVTSSIISTSDYGKTNFIRMLSSIRSWFIWLSPFIIGMTLFEREDLAIFYKSSIVICIIQVPLIILQARLVSEADFVTGLMGEWGSGILGIFQTLGSIYLLEFILSKRIPLIIGLMLVCLIMPPVILAKAMIVFLIMPISFLLLVLISKSSKKRVVNLLMICILLLVPILSMINIYTGEYSGGIEKSATLIWSRISVALENSATSYGGPTRLYYLGTVMQYISKNPVTLMFGYGLGYASSSRLSINNVNENILQYSTGVSSFIVTILLENGLMGVITIILFLVGIYSSLRKKMKYSRNLPGFDFDAVGMTTLIIISALVFYNRSFASPTLAWVLMPQLGIYVQRVIKKC